jgi:hypothetical protein
MASKFTINLAIGTTCIKTNQLISLCRSIRYYQNIKKNPVKFFFLKKKEKKENPLQKNLATTNN